MTKKDEFLLQLIDRVNVISNRFDTNVTEFVGDEKEINKNYFSTKEIDDKIKSISNDLGDLYQMIGNFYFKEQ